MGKDMGHVISDARKRDEDNRGARLSAGLSEAKALAAERTQAYYDSLDGQLEQAVTAFGYCTHCGHSPKHRPSCPFYEDEMVDTEFGRQLADYDPVERPSHYAHSRIEVWDAIDAWGLNYFLGNVVKYVARADRKGNAEEDLLKAAAYIGKELRRRGRHE